MTQILDWNLARLDRTDPDLAERVRSVAPLPIVTEPSRSGPITAGVEIDGRTISLASRYDPASEARRLTHAVDPQKHACAVALGMGLGYHVTTLVEILRAESSNTIVIVYEPSLPLLRAVLEVVDHEWLGLPNVFMAGDRTDRATLLGRIDKFGAILTQGTVLVTHPPSRHIHGASLTEFGRVITEIMSYCRTNIATTLVNSARTCRNLAHNAAHYAAGATTDPLHDAAAGYPAVCVGAGPSLARNVGLLTDPEVRRRVVVISAQTTLKPLLDRGIEPDVVTALDYHEISRRFYEGVGKMDRVTMVAEPLAHATILDSFPGPIRLTNSKFLDKLLDGVVPPRVPIPAGATVAHLSFYVAQHLGCDPIVLIGQDLGFTGGLYYCPGTAIHDVWANELGPFNTLEMMEWQRIVRHRGQLQKLADVTGRLIYTDEQMVTYLKQFERDFARAPQTVIDATEGGLPIQHTRRMTFAEALASAATRPVPPLPLPPLKLDADRMDAALRLLDKHLHEIAELRRQAGRTVRILRQMLEHQRDMNRMGDLFKKLEPAQQKVREMHTTFDLVNQLNAIGAFKRARADRSIDHSGSRSFERQRLQIDRDLENMDFLIEACDEARDIFRSAVDRLRAHRKRARRSPLARTA